MATIKVAAAYREPSCEESCCDSIEVTPVRATAWTVVRGDDSDKFERGLNILIEDEEDGVTYEAQISFEQLAKALRHICRDANKDLALLTALRR